LFVNYSHVLLRKLIDIKKAISGIDCNALYLGLYRILTWIVFTF